MTEADRNKNRKHDLNQSPEPEFRTRRVRMVDTGTVKDTENYNNLAVSICGQEAYIVQVSKWVEQGGPGRNKGNSRWEGLDRGKEGSECAHSV